MVTFNEMGYWVVRGDATNLCFKGILCKRGNLREQSITYSTRPSWFDRCFIYLLVVKRNIIIDLSRVIEVKCLGFI